MGTNYQDITIENLSRLFAEPPPDLEFRLNAEKRGDSLYMKAFGEECICGPDMITLSGRPEVGPRGLLVSLYATHAGPEQLRAEPFRSFREFPDSMAFQGAFSANSEMVLVPHVPLIRKKREMIQKVLGSGQDQSSQRGDFSFVLRPLPKIALLYIFYLEDEEFPPSATCLFSANALSFMPLDGLADTSEYTSKAIIRLIGL